MKLLSRALTVGQSEKSIFTESEEERSKCDISCKPLGTNLTRTDFWNKVFFYKWIKFFYLFVFQTLGSVFILRPAASSLSSLMKLSAPAALALSLPLCVSLCGSPSFFALAHLLEENREREGPGQHTDFPFVRLPHPTPPLPPLPWRLRLSFFSSWKPDPAPSSVYFGFQECWPIFSTFSLCFLCDIFL